MMYFIVKGSCSVKQIVKHGSSQLYEEGEDQIEEEAKEKKVQTLIESDNFGEISLIYECKRTCSVISSNYCTLATLSRSDFIECKRQSQFDSIERKFKQQICFYEDNVKLFIENELNKINYFKDLDSMTKNDIIFSMERISFN